MALGGGIWAVQNKVLPGTYIYFSSVAKASATLSDRGYAAMPLMLDWGPDSTVFTVTSGDFQKNSLKIFGHAYTDDALLPLALTARRSIPALPATSSMWLSR